MDLKEVSWPEYKSVHRSAKAAQSWVNSPNTPKGQKTKHQEDGPTGNIVKCKVAFGVILPKFRGWAQQQSFRYSFDPSVSDCLGA